MKNIENTHKSKSVLLIHILCLIFSLAGTVLVVYDLAKVNYAEYQKPWHDWWWQLDRLPEITGKEDIASFREGIEKYKTLIQIEPENPQHWKSLGDLSFRLATGGNIKEEKEEMFAQAQNCMENAILRLPTDGNLWRILAQIYSRQENWSLADRYMATTQILYPADPDFIYTMMQYWMNRYLKKMDDKYLQLLANRFLFLNRESFDRYGEKTLEIWEMIAPNISPWGTIFPREDRYAWQIAAIFWKRGNVSVSEEYLSYMSGTEYNKEKFLLQGEISLKEKEIEKAIALFRDAIRYARQEEKEKTAVYIGKFLVKSANVKTSMNFLKETSSDSLSNRLDVMEEALKSSPSQVLPFLENMADQNHNIPRIHFLLSQCYWIEKKKQNALDHAEKAFQNEIENERHASNLFQILFSLEMEEKVSYYVSKYEDRMARPALFYNMIAQNYFKKNKIDKAWDWIQKAVRLEPNNSEFQTLFHKIYLSLKKAENERH